MAFKKRPKLHNFSPSKEHIYKYKAVKNCFPPSEIPPTYLFLLSGSWTEAVVIPSSDRSTRINRISRIPKTWEHLTDWKTLLLWRISVIVKKNGYHMKTSMIGNISVHQTPPKAMWQINANRQDLSRFKNNCLFDDKKKRYGNTQKVDYLWIHETTRVMRAAFCQQY